MMKDSCRTVKEVGFLGLKERQLLLGIALALRTPCVPLLTWIINVCASEPFPPARDLLIPHDSSFLPRVSVCLHLSGHYLLTITSVTVSLTPCCISDSA